MQTITWFLYPYPVANALQDKDIKTMYEAQSITIDSQIKKVPSMEATGTM